MLLSKSKADDLCGGEGRRVGRAGMVAAGAEASTAVGAEMFVIVAKGAAARRAENGGNLVAPDGALRGYRALNDGLAPTFGLDHRAHL
jgi:hypothetical protein